MAYSPIANQAPKNCNRVGCKWKCPQNNSAYSSQSIRNFINSINTNKDEQLRCVSSMSQSFNVHRASYLQKIEQLPMYLFQIAQQCFFKSQGEPLTSLVKDKCGMTFSVGWSLMPGEENFSTAKTVWNMTHGHISMYLNRQLIPYCFLDQDDMDFYKTGNPNSSRSCKFQVGGMGCKKIGCVFELIIHEMCHVIEYCYRSCLQRNQWDIGYSADDDSNEIFCNVLYPLTYHQNPFNNLLARRDPELDNPLKRLV